MIRPRIIQLANTGAVWRAAAEEFVRVAKNTFAARKRFVVSLSGGSTPKGLYRLLAEPPFNRDIPWHQVEFFWGDERAVPRDHPDSNYHMASEAFLTKLAIPDARVHRMAAERPDRDAAAMEYQVEIARVFGVDPDGNPPRFDLVLLGIGPDGHTASLFPHTEALNETNRWVVSNYVPKLATHRLTLTPPILNNASCVLFLVSGQDKAEALAQVFEVSADSVNLPAQLIRPNSGCVTWFVDAEAAGNLTKQQHVSHAQGINRGSRD